MPPATPAVGAIDATVRQLAGFSGAVLVAHDGRVVLLRRYGRGHTDDLFDIGSIAKTFTAAAVLRLEQDGRLRVGDPISRYLRHVPARRRGITIHQLLTHTGGFPQSFDSDLERVGRAEAVRRILAAPGPPAGRFAYSNAGYTLLAAIVERVSGMPFQQFVRRRPLLPAGMASTGWFPSGPVAWVVATSARGTPVVLIGGDTDYGFTADFRRFVGERTAIVTLSESDRRPAGPVATRAEQAYFGNSYGQRRAVATRQRRAIRH